MRISPLTGLRTEDYPAEQRAWLGRLFSSMNPFFLSSTNALNGNIEFGSNIPSQDHDFSFSYDGLSLPKFTWNLPKPPRILMVGQATEDQQPLIMMVSWSYNQSTRQVSVTQIVALSSSGVRGLTTGKSYRISVRCIP